MGPAVGVPILASTQLGTPKLIWFKDEARDATDADPCPVALLHQEKGVMDRAVALWELPG